MADFAEAFRPITFNDVLGHDRYVRAFKNMIRHGRMPKCILLAGNSGVGKTTTARVLAAAAMCKNLDFETAEPCGTCVDCKSTQGINDGPNYMHLDGAGTGLKNIVEGELKAFLHSNPFGGARAKVCVADEAQALSVGAKNALLTLTENLPASSVFIMTTMDPEAIDFAIRSRSSCISFNGLTKDKLIEGVIKNRPNLIGKEDCLELLAECSKGSMREMWQLVQQLENFDEEITPDLAAWMSHSAKDADRRRIWAAIKEADFKGIVSTWDELIGSGANPDRLGEQLMNDLINMSAKWAESRDWAPAIRYLSQAQIMGTQTAWKASLCSLVTVTPAPRTTTKQEATVEPKQMVAAALGSEEMYKMLFGREPRS